MNNDHLSHFLATDSACDWKELQTHLCSSFKNYVLEKLGSVTTGKVLFNTDCSKSQKDQIYQVDP